MARYVAVNFSFPVNSLWQLKEVASGILADSYKYWPSRKPEDPNDTRPLLEDFENSYTRRMLEQVATTTEKYIHPGNKGDMFIWGGVWNYYTAEEEIPFIKVFLKRCYAYERDRTDVLADFERALLILNPEQRERTFIYEFQWDEAQDEIIVRTSESELNWMQY